MIRTNLNDLKNAIERIEKVVPRKTALPILETVNFKTINNETLQLYASDIEQFTTISIPCVTDETININIDVTTIKKALKHFKDDVTLNIIDNTLTLTDGNKSVKVAYREGKEMIDHPVFEISNTYTYDLQKFDTRLNKVKISIAKDSIRPLFTGVHLNNNAMVTVDGWRISMNTDNDLNIIEPITVPFSTLSLMQKLYGTKDKHTLTIKTSNKYTTFEFDNVTFTTRLLEGEYPKYEQLLNADLKNEVTADIEQLKENVKYICDMKEKGSRLPMKTIFDNGKVTFNYDCEEGSYSTSMQLDNKYEFKIAFNPDFVDDALTSIGKSKNVNLLLPDKNVNPMLIVNEEQTEKYLILPIRWNE